MLLSGHTCSNCRPANGGIHLAKGLVQCIQPPVRLLLSGSLIILIQIELGTLTGNDLPVGEIIKKYFEGLGAQVNSDDSLHGWKRYPV